ncbi:dihydrofolate reductase [Malassezia equina]|uniref:Dihydrofolate reductase n=1 Tax=Malassezia equina TaxID=1381935 RepID=A0AAF0J1S6_9BASI|nr:dihydrofolate reductase [Malassezia equina]
MSAARPGPSLGALPLTAVVAVSLGNGIGANGTLPWRLPKDMAYFRAATLHIADLSREDARMRAAGYERRATPMKNAVIMGRHTWDSIPPRFRPLKGRINVVISTTMSLSELHAPGVEQDDTLLARSLDEAVQLLQERRYARYNVPGASTATALGRAFVIGGAQLYRTTLTQRPAPDTWALDHMLVTRILSPVDEKMPMDVFLEEFRSPTQRARDEATARAWPKNSLTEADTDSEADPWHLVTKEEHATLVPPAQAELLGRVVDDQGLAIHFQCWRRSRS